jgi:uncharacterized protein (TIGR01777 family)
MVYSEITEMTDITNALKWTARQREKPLRLVLAGGSGRIGQVLARHFHGQGDLVTVLRRRVSHAPWRVVGWDGAEPGAWCAELDGVDVVNLAGRSVDCRYSARNRREILGSRVGTTQLLGNVIRGLESPPRLWMNMSTATIYRHAFDREMDEASGDIGGNELNTPPSWRFSINVATSWEEAFFAAETPKTRKIALRSAMVMSPERNGVFGKLLTLVRFGLGGASGSGKQFMSWIHETDFVRAIEYLIAHEEFAGAVNVAAPGPLPNAEFMQALRQAWGIGFGLPATRWMLEIGVVVLRTETELILKSRRVIPGRLVTSGFRFQFPEWRSAARDLVGRWRNQAKEMTNAVADIPTKEARAR